MNRLRSFYWFAGLRGPQPQIVFDDPRVGETRPPLFEQKLDPADTRTLDQLAAAYPAPITAETP